MIHEVRGQPIEKLRVAGAFTQHPEVAGRRDQSHSKMLIPEAVDPHASGEWISSVGESAGEFEATAAGATAWNGFWDLGVQTTQTHDRQQPGLEDFPRLLGIAPMEAHRGHRLSR